MYLTLSKPYSWLKLWVFLSQWLYWASPLYCSIQLRSWSAQVTMATACVQSVLWKRFTLSFSVCLLSPLFLSPLSGVFALPFTQWHFLPWGLTRQKQEMIINANTHDVCHSMANEVWDMLRIKSTKLCIWLWMNSLALLSFTVQYNCKHHYILAFPLQSVICEKLMVFMQKGGAIESKCLQDDQVKCHISWEEKQLLLCIIKWGEQEVKLSNFTAETHV